MPDITLHGNGEECPACALRRDKLRDQRAMVQEVSCNFCDGSGRARESVHITPEAPCSEESANGSAATTGRPRSFKRSCPASASNAPSAANSAKSTNPPTPGGQQVTHDSA